MKAIIKGSLYDTKTAKLIGSKSAADREYAEDLYRTKSGKYFLLGTGSPVSRYARLDDDNQWVDGQKIVALNRNDAILWAHKNIPGKQYDEHFSDTDADDMEALNILVPAHLKQRLWIEAEERKVTIASIAIEALIIGLRSINKV